MNVELNLLPEEYAARHEAFRGSFKRLLLACAAVLAVSAVFFLSVFALLLSRKDEFARARVERDEAMSALSLLDRKRRILRGRESVWRKAAALSRSQTPVLETLSAAVRALPPGGRIEYLSVSGERCRVDAALADAAESLGVQRKLGTPAGYSPFTVTERRVVRQGTVIVRFDAVRRPER